MEFGSLPAAVEKALPKSQHRIKFRKLPFKESPLQLFSRIHPHFDYAYFLESVEGSRKLAQYSFIGFDPTVIVTVKNGNETVIRNRKQTIELKGQVSNPLAFIKRIVSTQSVSNTTLRLVGGAVGYISYDTVRYWEHLPDHARDDTSFPDIEMGLFDDGIVFDHQRGRASYYYQHTNRLSDIVELVNTGKPTPSLHYTQPKVSITQGDFEASVARAKDYITSGDIFQVVLSKRYEFNFHGDLVNFYRSLRRINPSPYMYFLKMGSHQIVGSSPEMLVRVEKGTVETFPIAGTRPRVADPAQNRILAQELLSDPKERAEHVMLVDLARNDVGKVTEFGSVTVPEFMTVHEYSHVQHIVSRVVGNLRSEHDCYSALRALFPAGTVSGAPKVRAMEIIEESEPVRRGPYAGAVGYFSYNGNADFAITIRTLHAKETKAYIQVGAGIVADSIPEQEWFETEHKAEALMKALEINSGAPEDECLSN